MPKNLPEIAPGKIYLFVKRLLDTIVAACSLALLSPVLLIVSLAIKFESPGPVFYRGVRIGKYKRPFKIFKFRSMIHNADKLGGPSTRKGDPRLTRTGIFLRRFKFDELPQLINVLKGDMSLVGPRPEVPDYVNLYVTPDEKKILTVRPGITDLASLWNFHEEEVLAAAKSTEEAEKLYLTKVRPQKVKLQIQYVHSMSLLTDLKIIFSTIKKFFT